MSARDRGLAWLYFGPWVPVTPVRIRAIPSASTRSECNERSSSVGRFGSCESSCRPHPRGRDPWHSPRQPVKPVGLSPAVFSCEGVAHVGDDDSIPERPLPLAGCGSRLASLAVRNFEIPRYYSVSRDASLRAACGRTCVGSLHERPAPFEVPPDAGRPAGSRVTKHGAFAPSDFRPRGTVPEPAPLWTPLSEPFVGVKTTAV